MNLFFSIDGEEVSLAEIITGNYEKGPEDLASLVSDLAAMKVGDFRFYGHSIISRLPDRQPNPREHLLITTE